MTDKKPNLQAVPAAKKYKFIVGSEGGFDYLVTAKSFDVVLGVKPLIGVAPPKVHGGSPQLFVGARIRAAKDKMPEGSVVESDNIASFTQSKSFDQAFPNLKFVNVNETRASLEMGVLLPFTPWVKGSIEQSMQTVRYHWKLVEFLEKSIEPGVFVIEQDDFVQFIKDKYASMVADIEKQYPQDVPEVDPNAELEVPNSLFAKMLDPAKAQKEKVHKAGLKVVKAKEPDTSEDDHDDNDDGPKAA